VTTRIEPNRAEIGILIYPDAQLAAVHGLTDLFNVANRMAAARQDTPPTSIRVSHWQQDKKGRTPARVFDTHPDLKNKPQIVIAPPSLGTLASPQDLAPYASWLRERHAEGAALASVCAGAFLVAETGLLAGRAATTHWIYAETLKARYPDIDVAADKLIVDDGDIITAGGLMAWTDLGLKLVDRLLGPTIMADTARFLLVDPPGREQRYYSNFAPKLHHGDEAILKVQHWLQSKGARDVTLQDMATRAGMESRTFLRRFHKATGLKPNEYCQNVRVGKARELLEFTAKSIDQIAWSVGYEDAGAFRKVFQKVLGLTPGEYRNRFAIKRTPA
jgi:transcriptional regulator GlxA family with amidase domain